MARAKAKTKERKTNDWPWAVLALYVGILIAYLPILAGVAGPISGFQPDTFFAIVIAPISLVCLLCGALAVFLTPRPSMLALIGVLVLLLQVLAQLIWVVFVAFASG
jgi:hypothetical protein